MGSGLANRLKMIIAFEAITRFSEAAFVGDVFSAGMHQLEREMCGSYRWICVKNKSHVVESFVLPGPGIVSLR